MTPDEYWRSRRPTAALSGALILLVASWWIFPNPAWGRAVDMIGGVLVGLQIALAIWQRHEARGRHLTAS